MIELNENGGVVYDGDYKGTPRDGYMKNGKGDEFGKDDMLVYSGSWKNGKREGTGRYLSKKGKVLYEGKWRNGMIEIEKGVWFDYESGMRCLKKGENVTYRGEIMNGVPNGHEYVIDRNVEIIEGDWENGILTLSVNHYIELENGEFYMNELQSSGLFGCSHSWIHYLLSDMMNHCVKRTIRNEEKLKSIEFTVGSIIVCENCCNRMRGDLEISDYPCLKILEVKKNALQNLSSLRIANLPALTNIMIEDGEWNGSCYTSAFCNVKSVTITSNLIYD